VFRRGHDPPATPPATAVASGRPESPQLYMLNLGGGESWKITSLPRGASSPIWSPDSKWIAFNSTTNPDDLAKARRPKPDQKQESSQETPSKEQGAPEKPQAESARASDDSDHESDVRVITRAVYRMNEA